jgi:energy-coupling factor transporter ATP-binding protein EcfA2
MPLLDIKSLSVKYAFSNNYALKNVSFGGKSGELIIIAGKSGCGKSTLAQAILGIIPNIIKSEIEGSIHINGKPLSNLNREQLIRNLGYVPQYPADYITSLLVEEEIAFPLENLTLPRYEIKKRIKFILNQLDISSLKYRLMTELSSGELQRVSLATALAGKPPILILDEPMARIDPKSEVKLASILRELTYQGHLILVFEHRLDYLLSYADRLILIEDGNVTHSGDPRNLINELKDVDLPEISELNWPGQEKTFLEINEAKKSILRNFY